jgi:hypothetical protein
MMRLLFGIPQLVSRAAPPFKSQIHLALAKENLTWLVVPQIRHDEQIERA